MARRTFLAVLWGLAIWTWVSMGHVFLGTPEVGMLAGSITAVAIMLRGLVVPRRDIPVANRSGRLANHRS